LSEKVSKTKKSLEDYIKQNGFYWSKKIGRYVVVAELIILLKKLTKFKTY